MHNDSGWPEIPPFEINFQGVDGSSIRLTATSILRGHGAVSFDAQLALSSAHNTFRHEFVFADFDCVRPFRDELAAVRKGTGQTATMTGAGFLMTIEAHEYGPRDGLMVHGYYSSIQNIKHTPWPSRTHIGDHVLDGREDAACIRFAFRSSLVDPPFLDEALKQTNELVQFLRDNGHKL
jgi:hypothetical protein